MVSNVNFELLKTLLDQSLACAVSVQARAYFSKAARFWWTYC